MLKIKRTTTEDPDFIELASKLDEELKERYGAIQDQYEQYNKLEALDTAILAYRDDAAVGCGCFREYDIDTIEIKRMYVLPIHRRFNISKRILLELETWAISQGYKKAILETGYKQPESIMLYEKMGYEKIPNYEPYMEFVESVCFGKKLV